MTVVALPWIRYSRRYTDSRTGGLLPARPVTGRPGVRTRSALALAVGAAERYRSRAAVLSVLRDCALRRGETGRAAEVLTPVVHDPPSALPLAAGAGLLLARPGSAATLAAGAVRSYSISPATIAQVRATGISGCGVEGHSDTSSHRSG